ncbi:hypothetical protein ACK3TF_005781 [Chlorella vulgaris]
MLALVLLMVFVSGSVVSVLAGAYAAWWNLPVTAAAAVHARNGSGPWKCASLSVFESYPSTAKEGKEYNGFKWAGLFAGLSGKKSQAWVASNNIAAVHSRDFDGLKGKVIQVMDPDTKKTVEATVVDKCADSDCGGCCTRNADKLGCGFLIDLEYHTAKRLLGAGSDPRNTFKKVQWRQV